MIRLPAQEHTSGRFGLWCLGKLGTGSDVRHCCARVEVGRDDRGASIESVSLDEARPCQVRT